VVLGRITLAERDLREGRLVMPYNIALSTEAVYRVVYPAGRRNPPTDPHLHRLAGTGGEGPGSAYSEGMNFVAAADVAV
jgi:LysR family glycine cleavage system transcriptional activator